MKFLRQTVGIFFILAAAAGSLASANKPVFDPQIPSLQESRAYKVFLKRPYSELSRLLYLVDRYRDSKIRVIYDGIRYDPAFCAKVAKWFLAHHYRKGTAEEWIMIYANVSVLKKQLIWILDAKENPILSRELLTGELKALNEVCLKDASCQELIASAKKKQSQTTS